MLLFWVKRTPLQPPYYTTLLLKSLTAVTQVNILSLSSTLPDTVMSLFHPTGSLSSSPRVPVFLLQPSPTGYHAPYGLRWLSCTTKWDTLHLITALLQKQIREK